SSTLTFDSNGITNNHADGIKVSASGAGVTLDSTLGPADIIQFNTSFGVELSTAAGGTIFFTTDGATLTSNVARQTPGPQVLRAGCSAPSPACGRGPG